MFKRIKFFFSKLLIKEKDYDLLKWKAEAYEKMINTVNISISQDDVEIRKGKGNPVIAKFIASRSMYITINIRKLLKAGGYEFDKSVKIDVIGLE